LGFNKAMKKTTIIILMMAVFFYFGCKEKQDVQEKTEDLGIQANMVFFYYPDLGEAEQFYAEVLGFKKVLDYGFAKILRISRTSFIGLVDETKGMHSPDEPKTVTLSFVTDEIDGWYRYLQEQGVKMRGELGDATRHPTCGFVVYDPAGYFLEFERFLEHPQNEKLLEKLRAVPAVYPEKTQATLRPKELGIRANVIWLYYRDIPAAQRFYSENLGSELLVDQGFAWVYSSSSSAFVGLVDESQGLHRFSKTKAVNVCFISRQIDEWYDKLKRKELEIRDPLEDQANFPVRTFVIYDTGGYFLEFDWFLEDEKNTDILKYLTSTSK